MSPSQPFILRPVATTLLMIAIMLSGMLAFRFLPVAALPEVDYPTIQVQTFYPGASPDVMTSSVTAPLEVQFGQMPNLNQMSSVSSAGASVITLQFGLDDFARRRRTGSAGRDQRRRQSVALRPAGAADLRQGQPGRRADPDARTDLENHAADPGRGFRRYPPGAEDLPASRRRPRQHLRRPAAGGADPGRHPQARRLRAQHRRPPHHARQRQRQHAEGQFRRRDARLHHQRQRPDPQRQRLQVADRRLQERLAGAAQRCRRRRRRRAERQARRLDERNAGDHPEHPAPARRQRHRGGRGHQVAVAAIAGHAALRDRTRHPDRPHRDHPRLGAGRGIRTVARRHAGRAGDLRVPAQRTRHADPEPFGAAVAGRHPGGDVPVRLQPQQSVADGADDRHRFRGRRRHRRDRKHLALHRGGRVRRCRRH